MSKLITALVFASAVALGSYGVYQAKARPGEHTTPERLALVAAVTASPVNLTHAPIEPIPPRSRALGQPGDIYLYQGSNSPLGTVTLSPNASIGGSGVKGYTGTGAGYSWAFYQWTIPGLPTGSGMLFLEQRTTLSSFIPGSGGPNLVHRLTMLSSMDPVSPGLDANGIPLPLVPAVPYFSAPGKLLANNMVGNQTFGGPTYISPTP